MKGEPEVRKGTSGFCMTIIVCDNKMKKEIDRISQINEQQVTTVLDGVSENVMSKIYKESVLKLLLYRKEWLVNWYMEVK
ncbi:hypothetical protein NYE66_11010 [Geobacillus sp. FSL W8-0466]